MRGGGTQFPQDQRRLGLQGNEGPVYALFENLESGATVKEFLEWYPGVEEWQVAAVLKHEAEYFKTPARA